ncbi:MAG: hypothetical protein GF388_02195 [Candidatus Aegiribacteria sp.]|nr:hypothetical protein [Candidatus Aegiribacteria sp.]MBD3294135.1 hypothetical protein [Candidatus Fermentibacteria bacterium]
MFFLTLFTSIIMLGFHSDPVDEYRETVIVPPGGYAFAVCEGNDSLSDFAVVSSPVPGPWQSLIAQLPDSAEEAIQLCGAWFQEDLRTRFADLLYSDLQIEEAAVPAFQDLDSDGICEFILADSLGTPLRVLSTADWSAYNGDYPSSVPVLQQDSLLAELSYLELPDNCFYSLGDMGSDGLEDLVCVTESGRVAVWNNLGTTEQPLFQPFYQGSPSIMPGTQGAFVSPAVEKKEGEILLITGTCQNGLTMYRSQSSEDLRYPAWRVHSEMTADTLLNICPTAFDSGGNVVFLCGVRNGDIYGFSLDSPEFRSLDIPSVPGAYPDLAVALINDDEHPDLVAGTREGTTYYLRGTDGWFEGQWTHLSDLPAIPSGTPASYGTGLVFGSEGGELYYFTRENGREWSDVTERSAFHGVNPGSYSSPTFADLDGDGIEEMVTGNSSGELRLYSMENASCDGESIFSELYSWSFQPSAAVAEIEAYYSRYFAPYSVLRTPEAEDAVRAFSREIINAPAEFRDEIAYSIAATPTGVLREMYSRNDESIFTLNAFSIYEMAENLSYVQLEDSQYRTSCRLLTESGWHAVPDEYYYRFVVHPRILFESPAMVNAGFWRSGPDTLTMEMDEWLNWNPEDLYGSSSRHVFWRSFIPSDTSGGTTLAEIMSRASTCEDAVLRLCNFQSHSQPGGRMSFGYVTNDLQPMVIYEKAYGSCGEQSILQTALCRTFFIPAYVVGCRGEDHQWAHYLDPESNRWKHWDINYGLQGIEGVWVSGEGVDHSGKTISTVTAFGPENTVWPVTGTVAFTPGSGYMPDDSGYTATAAVTFTVVDSSGSPVPGALVLARSHWENANSVTEYDYTDSNGMASMDLGWEPHGGYTVDVISPFGSTGSTSISFDEGHSYTVEYKLSYSMPHRQNVEILVDGAGNSCPTKERLYPPHYYSTSLYTISSASDSIDVESRDWTEWPDRNTETQLLFMDSENFSKYRSGFSFRALSSRFSPDPGDTCFAVIDNRRSMFIWKEVATEPIIHGEISNREAYEWLNTPAEERELSIPQAEARQLNEDPSQRSWITYFESMEVVQDEPDAPLSSTCVIGPFTVTSDERSIELGTSSSAPGTDIDIFLFRDINGNRSVDGMNEMVASSTSPTSNETIRTTDIDTSSVYWLYVHGWKVADNKVEVDVGMSFLPIWTSVYDVRPVGWVTGTPDTCSFMLNDSTYGTGDIRLKTGNVFVFPELKDGRWIFPYPEGFGSNQDVVVTNSEGTVLDELSWQLDTDSYPPEMRCINMETDTSAMRSSIELICIDDLSGTAEVEVLLADSIAKDMQVEEDSIWISSIDVANYSGQSIPIGIRAEDTAGNEILERCTLDVPHRPSAVFVSCYPMSTVYNHRPVIQAHLDLDGSEELTDAELIVSDTLQSFSKVLKPVVQEGSLLQFRPTEQLEDGEYSAMVRFHYGEELFEKTWMFSVETMSYEPAEE